MGLSGGVLKLRQVTQIRNGVVVLVEVDVVNVEAVRVVARDERESDEAMNAARLVAYTKRQIAATVV